MDVCFYRASVGFSPVSVLLLAACPGSSGYVNDSRQAKRVSSLPRGYRQLLDTCESVRGPLRPAVFFNHSSVVMCPAVPTSPHGV